MFGSKWIFGQTLASIFFCVRRMPFDDLNHNRLKTHEGVDVFFLKRLELVDHLEAEEVGVQLAEAAFLVAIGIIQITFVHAVEVGKRHVGLEVVAPFEGRTDGEPPTVGVRNDGRTRTGISDRRGFVGDTSAQGPPIGKTKVHADRAEIGVAPLVLDVATDQGVVGRNVQFVKRRPVRPTEGPIKAYEVVDVPSDRSHGPGRGSDGGVAIKGLCVKYVTKGL